MSIPTNFQQQQGVALFLSLIMLLVLTVLGISSFQNSHIQERSAGNARLQSVAFEAAAAGAANSINFFDANRELGPDQACGELDHGGWDDATSWVSEGGGIGQATLKQRLYCLADEYPDEDGGRPARSQLFVLSRGEVTIGDQVVAQRDVEVRLDIGSRGAAGDGCGALCFPACAPGDYDFPNSNAFQVDGNGGPAVTAGCTENTEAIDDAIRDNRIGNYIGGIDTAGPGSPWDSPLSTEQFRAHLALVAAAAQAIPGNCQGICFSGGDWSDNGNTVYGTTADPQITYIHGNASFGGNISGAGIMFVNGTLDWNGTPNFQGLIVTLGGMFTIDGGGRGGNHAGSVVILNHPFGGIGEFGEAGFDNTGGGTAEYRFDCAALQAAWALLNDTGGGHHWSPECSTGPASPYDAGPEELIIASWRENIGWREHFFGSEEETGE